MPRVIYADSTEYSPRENNSFILGHEWEKRGRGDRGRRVEGALTGRRHRQERAPHTPLPLSLLSLPSSLFNLSPSPCTGRCACSISVPSASPGGVYRGWWPKSGLWLSSYRPIQGLWPAWPVLASPCHLLFGKAPWRQIDTGPPRDWLLPPSPPSSFLPRVRTPSP